LWIHEEVLPADQTQDMLKLAKQRAPVATLFKITKEAQMSAPSRPNELQNTNPTLIESISRRAFVRNAALAGTALAALGKEGVAQQAGSGSYSNNAISGIPSGASSAGQTAAEQIVEIKIRRAMLAGPSEISKNATVMDKDEHGKMVVLRKGTNQWVCMPGNENVIGDPPMCADPMAMQWFMDAQSGKPKPTNSVPGLCYMLCGATQHSNTDAFDNTSPAIPIGPHWMIMWPFDAKACGLPTTVRDAGAWVMFDGTPFAYLHICGTPWIGNEYQPGTAPVWTMQYTRP
jgi:hypothetical protein